MKTYTELVEEIRPLEEGLANDMHSAGVHAHEIDKYVRLDHAYEDNFKAGYKVYKRK